MKKCLLLMLCCLLAGCFKMNIQLDWNYGVCYAIESQPDRYAGGGVTVFVDPEHPDVVAALFITCLHEPDTVDQEMAEKLMQENSSNHQNSKNEKTVYEVQKQSDGKSAEWIRINFSRDDLNLKEHALLIEYLGLEKELADGILYYEKELLKSKTFRYQWLLEEGSFENNISFTKDPKYEYPKKTK